MSSNVPIAVAEQFPLAIEQLLVKYIGELGPQDSLRAWEAPAELIKRLFSSAPSATLCAHLRSACVRLPIEHDACFWVLCRCLPPAAGSALVRSWLLRHSLTDTPILERAANHVLHKHGEHAAALDFLRWAHAMRLPACRTIRARALYFKVLRHGVEERAAASLRLERNRSSGKGVLDMSTEQPGGGTTHSYQSRLTGKALIVVGLTQEECVRPLTFSHLSIVSNLHPYVRVQGQNTVGIPSRQCRATCNPSARTPA